MYSGIVFLYHLIVHYLGIWEFLLHLIFWFWKFKGIVKFQWSSLTKLFYIWKAPASKTFVLCFSNFNLAKKNLCSENRCARFLRAVCFWKDIDILLKRVGKSSRTKTHKSLRSLGRKINLKIAHTLLLDSSNNKNQVCTKFLLNISILWKVTARFRGYHATFKVRKFESLLYRINTCLQKATTCIGMRAEQIFSLKI